MPRNELGRIRRSQVITNAGPGAIVDFRTDRGSASVVPLGLESWPAATTVVREVRLERRLGVTGFRAPAVVVDQRPPQRPRGSPMPATRFPHWQLCPRCNLLQHTTRWGMEAGEPALHCGGCSANQPNKTYVIPAPFVTACESGHLDEFPWDGWAEHQGSCTQRGVYRLRSDGGAGLSALLLECEGCHRRTVMEGAFSPDALQRFGRCPGTRPWLLGSPNETCGNQRRTLQRGASNLYFPVIASALDIPPWSDRLQQRLKRDWDRILTFPEDQLRPFIGALGHHREFGMTPDQFFDEVLRRRQMALGQVAQDLRLDEYRRLTASEEVAGEAAGEFETRLEKVPSEILPWVSRLVRVVRLREVRALRAFTRVRYPDPEVPGQLPDWAPLSATPLDWLPAVEIRGEGIFVELDPKRISAWEESFDPRAAVIRSAWENDWSRRHPDVPPPRHISARLLLVHSLAHAVIRQLSLDCGYSAASLRERLYVDDGCSGFLVYTAAPDADGTLGGLARQGRAKAFVQVLRGALNAQVWCSSDPLCAAGIHSTSDQSNGAACHSCLLVAETSCEEFNRLLDRQTLVGAPDNPALSYFAGSTLLT